jgi:serine/threonine protein phosphatase PrpC
MTGGWITVGRSHPGLVRDHNEDAWGAWPSAEGGVLALADGMGGMAQGAVASAAAIAVFAEDAPRLDAAERPYAAIFDALRRADEAVHLATPQGGTTGVLAVLRGDRAWFGWVGDSRLYHARGGVILDRTVDHTQVAERVARGELSAEEAAYHPDAHILANALGAGDARPEVFTEPLEVEVDDVVLLCSDGLTDLVADDEIARACLQSPDAAADALVDLALQRGGHDNITVLIARRAPDTRPTLAERELPQAAPSTPAPTWRLAVAAALAGLVAGFALGRATAPSAPSAPSAAPTAPPEEGAPDAPALPEATP